MTALCYYFFVRRKISLIEKWGRNVITCLTSMYRPRIGLKSDIFRKPPGAVIIKGNLLLLM